MVYDDILTGPARQVGNLSRRLVARAQHLFLPPRCIACGGGANTMDLCCACLAQLPVNQQACRCCALPLSGTQTMICGRCLRRPLSYQASWCAFEYRYPLTHLIRRMKYGGALAPSRVLGGLLAEYLRAHRAAPWPECFIPVPLHAQRYRTRGYNQVIELGRHLEQALGVRMRTDMVARIRHTAEQAGLSRGARRRNLRRAFVITQPVPKHIALLDDVITTGSTMNELTRTLKQAGAEQIEVWGVARAVIKMKQ